MAIQYNGVDVTGVVYNGNTVNELIYNGTSVFTPGGSGGGGGGGSTEVSISSESPVTVGESEHMLAFDSSVISTAERDAFNSGSNITVSEPTRLAAGFDGDFEVNQFTGDTTTDPMRFMEDGTLFFPGTPTVQSTTSYKGNIRQSSFIGSPSYISDTYLKTPKSGYLWFKPVLEANGDNHSTLPSGQGGSSIIFSSNFYADQYNLNYNVGGVRFDWYGPTNNNDIAIGKLYAPTYRSNLITQDNYGYNAGMPVPYNRILRPEVPDFVYEDWHLLVWSVQNSVNGDNARSRTNVWFDGAYYNQTRSYHYQNSQPDSGTRPYPYSDSIAKNLTIGMGDHYYNGSVNGMHYRGYMGDFKIYINRYFEQADADAIWNATKANYGK